MHLFSLTLRKYEVDQLGKTCVHMSKHVSKPCLEFFSNVVMMRVTEIATWAKNGICSFNFTKFQIPPLHPPLIQCFLQSRSSTLC